MLTAVLTVTFERGMFILSLSRSLKEPNVGEIEYILRTYSRRGEGRAREDAILIASALQVSGVQVAFKGESLKDADLRLPREDF